MLVGLNDSVELHRRVPTSAATACPTPCQLRSVGDEACCGDMTSSSWLIQMRLGGSDDRSVLDSDEYPTVGRQWIPCRPATHAFSAVDAYVFGFVLSELNLPMEPGETADEFVQEIGIFTEAYPHLAEMLAEQVMGKNFSYADEFDYGLELILDGLEERLGRS